MRWRETRWRVLPYVVYICRNGNIVLGNRRYLPLWVWEREPDRCNRDPDWKPVDERAFVRGIVWTLHTYNDGNCHLPRKKMIEHVNNMLHSFHLGGLPQGWERHGQATDQEEWRSCYSPEEGATVLDFR